MSARNLFDRSRRFVSQNSHGERLRVRVGAMHTVVFVLQQQPSSFRSRESSREQKRAFLSFRRARARLSSDAVRDVVDRVHGNI